MLLETISVLDSLEHTEPVGYYNTGNWTKPTWCTSEPTTTSTGAQLRAFGTQTGTFYNATSFSQTNQACSMKTNTGSDVAERFWELWICFNNSLHNGYRAKFTHVAASTFTPTLWSVTEGTETKLGEGTAVTAETLDVFGIMKEGTAISVWWKHSSGAWTESIKVTSSTFTSGNVAFGGQGSDPKFLEFKAGQSTGEAVHGKPFLRVISTANARASTI